MWQFHLCWFSMFLHTDFTQRHACSELLNRRKEHFGGRDDFTSGDFPGVYQWFCSFIFTMRSFPFYHSPCNWLKVPASASDSTVRFSVSHLVHKNSFTWAWYKTFSCILLLPSPNLEKKHSICPPASTGLFLQRGFLDSVKLVLLHSSYSVPDAGLAFVFVKLEESSLFQPVSISLSTGSALQRIDCSPTSVSPAESVCHSVMQAVREGCKHIDSSIEHEECHNDWPLLIKPATPANLYPCYKPVPHYKPSSMYLHNLAMRILW